MAGFTVVVSLLVFVFAAGTESSPLDLSTGKLQNTVYSSAAHSVSLAPD
jgi:hypothetical protein